MGLPNAKNEETQALCRQIYNLRVENVRINRAAAAEVNRIRDEMETLRHDNAENLKNVRQHYVARVGDKTQKINALHRQRVSDAQRHFAEVACVHVQLVAQNARHRRETAELRLAAAADFVNIRGAEKWRECSYRVRSSNRKSMLIVYIYLKRMYIIINFGSE